MQKINTNSHISLSKDSAFVALLCYAQLIIVKILASQYMSGILYTNKQETNKNISTASYQTKNKHINVT